MEITILTPDGQSFTWNVNPSITVEDLKKLVKAETRVPLQVQQMLYNGKEMRNSKRLRKYGVRDGGLVVMERSDSPSRISNSELGFNPDGSAVDPSAFRQHILNDDDMMARISWNDPELAEILRGEDDDEWLQLFLRTRHSQRAELQRDQAEAFLLADESDAEVRERIEAAIKAWNAEELELIPNYIKDEECPYIALEVNGKCLKALVDTGAEMSVMSKHEAERCGLSNLIDPCYTEAITGVGQQNAVGRINIAPIKIGNIFCLSSFVLFESTDCVVGIDILRKNQCVIDTKANVLKIRGGDDVPFLPGEDSNSDE